MKVFKREIHTSVGHFVTVLAVETFEGVPVISRHWCINTHAVVLVSIPGVPASHSAAVTVERAYACSEWCSGTGWGVLEDLREMSACADRGAVRSNTGLCDLMRYQCLIAL